MPSKNGKTDSEDLIAPEALADSLLRWEASTPYEPDDPDDFPSFYNWVMSNLAPVIKDKMGKRLPDNPTLVRMKARDAFQLLWWINGALTEAEDYLVSAQSRSTFLEWDDSPSSPELKKRQDYVCSKEKRLVSYLSRVRETIIKLVSYQQSDLGFIKEDLKMTAAEDSRTYGT